MKTEKIPVLKHQDIIKIEGRPFRIVSRIVTRNDEGNPTGAELQIIALDKRVFEIRKISIDEIEELFEEGLVFVCIDEDNYQLPDLEEGDFAMLNTKYHVIKQYIDSLYPDLSVLQKRGIEKEGLKRCSKLLEKSERHLRRIILKFLQGGQTLYSLLDDRMTRTQRGYDPAAGAVRGPKKDGRASAIESNEEMYANFEEAYCELQRLLNEKEYHARSKDRPTISSVYTAMCRKHYYCVNEFGQKVIAPDHLRPSLKRFERWLRIEKWGGGPCRDHLVSAKDWNNNRRTLTGDAHFNIHHPGELFEIDETEVSFDLTTADPERQGQDVGGAIIHNVVDIATNAWVAVMVTIQVNNSYEGVLNVFELMIMDNDEKCRMLGVEPDGTVAFPGMIIPEEIRVDHGSEYISKALKDNLTGGEEYYQLEGVPTTIALTRPGTGSNKAIVERSFSEFERALASATGYRHGHRSDTPRSKHRIETHVNIIQLRRIIYEIVKNHNNSVLTSYPFTPELIERVPSCTPLNLWGYLSEQYGAGITLDKNSRNSYRFSLMLKRSLRISRKQIWYKQILYWDVQECKEVWDRTQLKKDKSDLIEVRYDPRTVSRIYYKDKKGTIYEFKLATKRSNQKSFSSMSWAEFDRWYDEVYVPYKKSLKEQKKNDMEKLDFKIYELVNNADTSPVAKTSTKEIRKAGKIERSALTIYDNCVRDKIFGTSDSEDIYDVEAVEVPYEEVEKIDMSDPKKYAEVMGLDLDDK